MIIFTIPLIVIMRLQATFVWGTVLVLVLALVATNNPAFMLGAIVMGVLGGILHMTDNEEAKTEKKRLEFVAHETFELLAHLHTTYNLQEKDLRAAYDMVYHDKNADRFCSFLANINMRLRDEFIAHCKKHPEEFLWFALPSPFSAEQQIDTIRKLFVHQVVPVLMNGLLLERLIGVIPSARVKGPIYG
jgi:Ni/Fe-hydrogenase subunit HybB-like protein